jgi:hypothetical protein
MGLLVRLGVREKAKISQVWGTNNFHVCVELYTPHAVRTLSSASVSAPHKHTVLKDGACESLTLNSGSFTPSCINHATYPASILSLPWPSGKLCLILRTKLKYHIINEAFLK